MTEGFAQQYEKPCLILNEEDMNRSPRELIQTALNMGAIYEDADGVHFVVQFPGRPQELYTERAFRSSLLEI